MDRMNPAGWLSSHCLVLDRLLFLGLLLITYFGLVLVASAVGRFLGVEFNIGTYAATLFVAVLVAHFASPGALGGKLRCLGYLFLLTLVLGSLAALLEDTSWDGMSYHLPAVIQLAEGWNPVTDDSQVYWANYYPNGIWSLQAGLYAVTGSFEATKVLNILLALSAYMIMYSAIREIRGCQLSGMDIVLLLALVANPVLVSQLFTFYIDGALYSLVLILLGSMLLGGSRYQAASLLGIFFGLVLILNTKLAGIYFALALCAVSAVDAFSRRQQFARQLVVMFLGVLIGAGIVGFRPYVTNISDHGTPIYLDLEESLAHQIPENLAGRSAPGKLLYSIFSYTESIQGAPARLKLPFVVHPREFYYMGVYDVRVGGFGPFFAAELIAVAVASFALFWASQRLKLGNSFCFRLGIYAFGILAMAAIFPEAWLARYVPMFWAVPLLIVLAWQKGGEAPKWRTGLLQVAVVLALGNAFLALAGNSARSAVGNWKLATVMDEIEAVDREVVIMPVEGGWFHITFAEKLKRRGVAFRMLAEYPCVKLLYQARGMKICA